MKTEMTMYKVLLETGVSEEIATAILGELSIEKHRVLPFEPGRVLATQGVKKLEKQGISTLLYLMLNLVSDVSKLSEQDQQTHTHALQSGGRIISVFNDIEAENGTTLYIYNAGDRSYTLLLLSQDRWIMDSV
ncbi:hypothetical protein [Pseudomonas gingeri]|uniref:hypothetical protein n=1 Tax=Pseudomonas gingeri TaxID=117681 RepID=UPI0015A373DB|nr:hypothetical protein [Pseudomonas gingeri]NWA08450.1 hypothetical protein [Pseudomonas gingeri]